jgi:long-chain acyl-CoA synthetase
MIEKPWHRHYDKGVPHSLSPYPGKTLLDVLRERADREPDRPALYFKGATMTYAGLERESTAFAAALVAQGVRPGERVALLLPNSPQMIVAEFGIWKSGAIAVPINPLYTENELEHALNECGAETAVVLTLFYSKIDALRKKSSLKRVITSSIKDYLPPLKRVLFTLLKEKREGHRIEHGEGNMMMQELIARHSNDAAPDIEVKPEDSALFLFSGGTTGRPKCAVGTHHNYIVSGMQIGAWFSVVLDSKSDTVMLNMPLFHVYAQLGILSAGLIYGYPLVVIPNPRDIDDLLHTIRTVKPAVLPGVPTLFNALVAHPRLKKEPHALRSLKLIVSGASSLHLETKKRFEELTGGRIIEAYALTESMIASVCTPVLGTYKHGSVGIPAPDVDIRIVDQEGSGAELATGVVGEILMQAPQLMQGYWQNPQETANILRNGWLYTGDLGYLDEDGYLFIVDRMKDVIKPGGFQVWPREVEEVIARHPSVLEVGVAGIPDDYQGESVKAWVVVRDTHKLTLDEIRAHCRQELAGYKVPKHIEFRHTLPKSMIGKVLRRKLVEEEREKGTSIRP